MKYYILGIVFAPWQGEISPDQLESLPYALKIKICVIKINKLKEE